MLQPRGAISLVTTTFHDPDSYYKTRSGLDVWGGFRSSIAANAIPTPAGARFNLSVSMVVSDAADAKIEAALSPNHLFDETTVCAIVAAMVTKQEDGEDGDLENTGHANVFYTRSCVVYVFWHGTHRRWSVFTWERVGAGWGTGDRVFAAAS